MSTEKKKTERYGARHYLSDFRGHEANKEPMATPWEWRGRVGLIFFTRSGAIVVFDRFTRPAVRRSFRVVSPIISPSSRKRLCSYWRWGLCLRRLGTQLPIIGVDRSRECPERGVRVTVGVPKQNGSSAPPRAPRFATQIVTEDPRSQLIVHLSCCSMWSDR